MTDKRPIGIFDSGIGGLTVLRELQARLPHEDFAYFADTANLPYGEKTPAQILDYSRRIITWMQDEIGCKLVIAACHTSSALALDKIAAEFNIPLIGTIYPLMDTILTHYPSSRIGILATPASVKSRVHEKIMVNAGFQGKIFSISCPDFVPLIEEGYISGSLILDKAQEYLNPFSLKGLDTLLFGCTHYPLIRGTIERLLPATVNYIDPANSIALKVSQEIHTQNISNNIDHKGTVEFYCSSNPHAFSQKISQVMSIFPPSVRLKDLYATNSVFPKIAVNQ